MKTILTLLALLFSTLFTNAQTTAMDFTMDDCNGQMHNLYSELDSGNVVILEFFMLSCGSCIDAGEVLEALHTDLANQYAGNKIRYYHFGYSNSYTCSSISNWVTTNGFSSTPFDSGGTQVAYYGGMGMPTIAVVAGNTHEVLFTSVGFSTSDSIVIAAAIRNFMDSTTASIQNKNLDIISFNVFPNPSSGNFDISFEAKETGILILELTDIAGKKIMDLLVKENLQAGLWNYSFTLNNLSNGVYFLKGRFNEKVFSEKINIQ